MAKRWLPALRGARGPGVETKGLAERVRSSSVTYSVSGVPYSTNWNVNRAVREGFQANPWIFRAVEVMAYTSLRRRIVLREGDPDTGTLVPITADPSRLLYTLNRRSNPWETAKMFRYRLWAQFLLSSKGVYIEVARSRAGRIAMMTLLDPDLVEVIPSVDNPISAFEVSTTGDTGGKRDPLPPFDPEDPEQTNSVLWIRSPHPTVLTQGMSPIEAAGLSVDLDRYARLYNRDYMQSNGRPGGILGVRGSVTPETVTALQHRFNSNARPGAVTAIQADAMFYQDLSTAPRDMQWGEVMDRMRKEAAMTFGVPESMMGDASGRCVDMETEALTKRGWLRGDEITTDDTILSMDPADGVLKWSPVHEVYRAHYCGDMYRLKHSHADFLVTPGHNWAVEPGWQDRRDGNADRFVLRKVEDLSTKSRIRTIGDAEAGVREPVYSSAFVELVGWAVTEGAYYQGAPYATNYIVITQNEGPHAERIRQVCKESGALWSEGEQYGREQLRRFRVRGEIADALVAVSPEKVMGPAFLLALTAEQRHLLMRTMLDADGCTAVPNTASWTFAQKDRRAAEAFVFLATLCGYTTSIRERTYTYRHKGVERPAHDWIVVVRQRKVMTIQRQTRTVEQYDGRVWCPRTSYGTFVARRQGKVSVTGNTFDNADAEYGIFMEHRFAPLAELVDDQLDVLTGGYSDDLWLRHDLSDVWVLKRHRRAEEDRMAAELERGVITLNDYREFLGLDPIDASWARVHWIAPGKAAGHVDDAGDGKEAANTPVLGQPQPADPGAEAQAGAEMGAGIASYNAQTNAAAANLRQVTAAGQGRSSGGGFGALTLAHGKPLELEGKQSRGRPGRAAIWR